METGIALFLEGAQALGEGGCVEQVALAPALVVHLLRKVVDLRRSEGRPTATDAQAQLRLALEMFERSFARSPWLLGEQPSIADFSSFHPLWFMARAEVAHTALAPYPATRRWFDRIASLGHGQRQDISSAEAIGIAAAATSHAAVRVDPGLGFQAADAVTVSATDYGTEPVRGTLVGLGIDRVTLERQDERAGTVHVHFPRRGFEIRKLA